MLSHHLSLGRGRTSCTPGAAHERAWATRKGHPHLGRDHVPSVLSLERRQSETMLSYHVSHQHRLNRKLSNDKLSNNLIPFPHHWTLPNCSTTSPVKNSCKKTLCWTRCCNNMKTCRTMLNHMTVLSWLALLSFWHCWSGCKMWYVGKSKNGFYMWRQWFLNLLHWKHWHVHIIVSPYFASNEIDVQVKLCARLDWAPACYFQTCQIMQTHSPSTWFWWNTAHTLPGPQTHAGCHATLSQ